VVAAGFLQFWTAYPRRVAKKTALRAWNKLAPDEALRDRILTAIEEHKRSPQWRKDGGQFIPHPATWLNQRRWEDDPAGVMPVSGATQFLYPEEIRNGTS
jgi:hypothetical protein